MPSTFKVLFCVVLSLVGALAFFGIFGFFSVHDDEGYNVAMVRLVAENVPLYTDQFAYHGPVPYLTKALLLTALGAPITHQSVRLFVMAVWLLSALLLTAAVWNVTRKWIAALGTLLVMGCHLFPLRFNPGHPEDFAILFLSLAIFLVSSETINRSRYLLTAVLGLIGAILVGTKINVGILYLLGMSLWMLAQFPRSKFGVVLRVLFLIGATGVPAVLMHASLLPEWQLLLISTLSILLTCSAVLFFPMQPRFGVKDALFYVVSVMVGIAGTAVAAMAQGSRWPDLLSAVIVTAAKHPNVFLRPVSFGSLTIPIVGAFVLLCVSQFVAMTRATWTETAVPSMLKIFLALCALLLAAVKLVEYYMPLVGPVCWLIVFPGSAVAPENRSRCARLFLASVAVFQVLQAFPVQGSQTAWSTLLLSMCCVLLLHDGMMELSWRPTGIPRTVVVLVKLVAALTFSVPLMMTAQLASSYFRSPSLGFSESNLIRIPLGVRAKFDWVVASTSRYCDAVVTQPGLNSFLLWSKSRENVRGTPFLITGWPLILTDGQERETIAKLRRATSVCAIYSKRLSDWWTLDGPQLTASTLARQPLVAYIRDLSPIQEVGDYQIRGNAAALGKWNVDYLLNGIRKIHGSRDAVGIPAGLLSGTDFKLIFEFQADQAGPLLSVQQSGAKSDEDTIATEPVTYIAQNGVLMIRKTAGAYTSSLSASVLDGLWHEISVQRDPQGWRMFLDGHPVGRTPELLTGADQPRYLQLGPAFGIDGSPLGQGWSSFFGQIRDVRVTKSANANDQLSSQDVTALR